MRNAGSAGDSGSLGIQAKTSASVIDEEGDDETLSASLETHRLLGVWKLMTHQWYNFTTRQVETRETPTCDVDALHYVSQDPMAQQLYRFYRTLGIGVGDALTILVAHTGVPDEDRGL